MNILGFQAFRQKFCGAKKISIIRFYNSLIFSESIQPLIRITGLFVTAHHCSEPMYFLGLFWAKSDVLKISENTGIFVSTKEHAVFEPILSPHKPSFMRGRSRRQAE
ncbi:MAG: hypothetical protein DRR08_02350 [Candidatus Parabeggiatoa sp. nov. 2]|nr:MAG: hypothetical protein B6247_20905 [Beggiatoa sp. 4572_84]RKZ63858.1 MAG: hypothetical protein DRR08_02350 [Gammaproteobacteria bacterium]HEC85323.1 hypothetical protein [Thioploca sp.]